MSNNMKKYAEEENAKPKFFHKNGQIYQRGETKYNEEKGTCSQGMHVAVAIVSEWVDDEQVGELITKALNENHLLKKALNTSIEKIEWLLECSNTRLSTDKKIQKELNEFRKLLK